jgi:hypothetical protein
LIAISPVANTRFFLTFLKTTIYEIPLGQKEVSQAIFPEPSICQLINVISRVDITPPRPTGGGEREFSDRPVPGRRFEGSKASFAPKGTTQPIKR